KLARKSKKKEALKLSFGRRKKKILTHDFQEFLITSLLTFCHQAEFSKIPLEKEQVPKENGTCDKSVFSHFQTKSVLRFTFTPENAELAHRFFNSLDDYEEEYDVTEAQEFFIPQITDPIRSRNSYLNRCQRIATQQRFIKIDAVKLDKGVICCSCSEKLKNPQKKLICSRCGRGIRPGYEEQCDNCDDGVFHLQKFPPPEPNPDEPNPPEKNFSPPVVAEPAKRQTPPRDAQGRFIKKKKNYPKEKRGEVMKIGTVVKGSYNYIYYLRLTIKEGHLDLRDFVNLRGLYLASGKITSIDLSKCINLENIQLADNLITDNLNIFSHLTKLKRLDLGLEGVSMVSSPKNHYDYKNSFPSSSLKSLEKCKELEFLCIANLPNIKGGLEFLPAEKLTFFGCVGTEFEEQVKPFNYNVKNWQLAQKGKKYQELENQLETLKKEISKLEKKIEKYETAAVEAIKRVESSSNRLLVSSEGLELGELKARHKELQDEYKKALEKKQLTEIAQEYQTKNEELEQEKQTAQTQFQEQQNRITELEAENASLGALKLPDFRAAFTKKQDAKSILTEIAAGMKEVREEDKKATLIEQLIKQKKRKEK
ncbi:1869_t:CDS:2, partial [Racocetra fulgida]